MVVAKHQRLWLPSSRFGRIAPQSHELFFEFLGVKTRPDQRRIPVAERCQLIQDVIKIIDGKRDIHAKWRMGEMQKNVHRQGIKLFLIGTFRQQSVVGKVAKVLDQG